MTTRNAWNNENNAVSARAYLEVQLNEFVARHEHAQSAEIKTYETKTGNTKIKLVVSCNDTYGRVNVEVGSTFSLDWERIDSKFEKNHDKLVSKERENIGVKPARKPSKVAQLESENAQLQAQIAAMHAAMVAAGILAA